MDRIALTERTQKSLSANRPRPAISQLSGQVLPLLQRQFGCACGGGCPRCAEEQQSIQKKLRISTPGDQDEQEADRVAEQVIRTPELSHTRVAEIKTLKDLTVSPNTRSGRSPSRNVPPAVDKVLRSTGEPLEGATRSFMESRFGQDFARVRVHTDRHAAESAKSLKARAYTVGDHIVFGAGEYEPRSTAGRQLLAHELTHVVQQSHGGGESKAIVQRVPTLDILEESFIGPPGARQRRAERSCPINCCSRQIGSLHAMPLQHQRRDGTIVPAGSPLADNIGAALHFIAERTQPADGRCHCDDFRMIQVIESNDPADPRGNSFVDNNFRLTPFYGDIGPHGRDEDPIPPGYVDAGETVQTTESIYDRPFRTPAGLAASGLATNLSWMAETCVACIKNSGPDRILGCVTYGFTRAYNSASRTFAPVVGVSPGCLSRPTTHFVVTLLGDPGLGYSFDPAPDRDECQQGDFPVPRGDARVA